MAGLLDNQNTGIDNILAEQEQKRKEVPQVTAPLTETKSTDLNNPIDLEQQLRQIYFPEYKQPRYSGATSLTNQDFYPQLQSADYIQRPGGFDVVASKGALIPFGAIAQLQNEKRRTDSVLKAKKELANTWNIDVGHINQAKLDSRFQDLYVNTYSQTKNELSQKYGDNWVSVLNNDPSYMNRFNKLGQLRQSINSDLALASKYLEEDVKNPVYKDPEATKYVNSLLGAYDNIMSNTSADPKEIDKWYSLIAENRNKIIEQRDINTSIKEYSTNLNNGIKETYEQYKAAKALGNSENDIINTVKTGSPFLSLETDASGKEVWRYDENGAKKSWASFYEENYGAELEKDLDGNYITDNGKYKIKSYQYEIPAPDVNKFINAGLAATKKTVEIQVKDLNTKSYEYWAKSRDIKKEDRVPTIYREEGDITVGNNTVKNPYNFEQKNVAIPIVQAVNASIDAFGNQIPNGTVFNANITAYGEDDNGKPVVVIRGKSHQKEKNPETGVMEDVGKPVTIIQPADQHIGTINRNVHAVGFNDNQWQTDKDNTTFSIPVKNSPKIIKETGSVNADNTKKTATITGGNVR